MRSFMARGGPRRLEAPVGPGRRGRGPFVNIK